MNQIVYPDTEITTNSSTEVNTKTIISQDKVLVYKNNYVTESVVQMSTVEDVPRFRLGIENPYQAMNFNIEFSDNFNKIITEEPFYDEFTGVSGISTGINPNPVKLPSIYSETDPIHTFKFTFHTGRSSSVTIGCSETNNVISLSSVPETITPTLTDEYLPIEVNGVKRYIRLYED